MIADLPKIATKTQRAQLPNKETIGVDRASRMWETLYRELKRRYPDEEDAIVRKWADIDQVLEQAKLRRFKDWGHESLELVLDKFDAMCADALPGRIGERNALRGSLAEYLFLPNRGKDKNKVWLNGKEQPWGTKDATVPDDWYDVGGGVLEGLNLKSDRIHDPTADLKAITAKYFGRALIEAGNQPPGTRYALWFVRTPKDPAGLQAMVEIFSGPGTRISRVRFGKGDWIDIPAPTPP